MPELPEVETIVSGLKGQVVGLSIKDVSISGKKLREDYPEDIELVHERKITSVKRRSKYILIELDNEHTIVFHLGMSGKLLFVDEPSNNKHNHVVITMADRSLVFNDPRRFGLFSIIKTDEIDSHKLFAGLGLEPLENCFSAKEFAKMLAGKKSNIKSFIMNAKYIVGVGNIYASESLYNACIHPLREAGSLKSSEVSKLYKSIVEVLKSAIQSGGSTLRDYVRSDGDVGGFQHKFNVYDKAGVECGKCSNPIERIVISNRSTYFCPKCQI